MNKKISYIIIAISMIFTASLDAQSKWSKSSLSEFRLAPEEDKIVLPEDFLAYELSIDELKASLKNVPGEENKRNGVKGTIISLPLPDGTFERFEMYDAPVLAPKLAAKYPSIKSYKGRSLENPGMNVRFDTGPYGFHAAIHSQSGVYYIDPYSKGNTTEYITYDVKDQSNQVDFEIPMCGNHDEGISTKSITESTTRSSGPVPLSVYRIAIACTGEWGAQRGTIENALADINTAVNRVNQIYENDLAMRLVVVENNDLLLNFDSSSDPYGIVINPSSHPNPTIDESNALTVNTNILNARIGVDSYDVGHLFHTACNVGGIARLGSFCNASIKGAGLTCHYTGLNYMAAQVTSHEIGHQMSAQHTFNNCSGNESPGNAFEPGSGSTIMSYGGSCNSNNVVGPFQDEDYYHVASLIQIYSHTRGSGLGGEGCAELIETSNIAPSATILHENDFYIPENTYFFLRGEGEDENEEDELTYGWEQMNIGPTSPLGQPEGDAPHFRSLRPNSSPIRYFPSPDNILQGSFDRTEVAFRGNRTVNFMFTVRDNNSEAGTAVWEDLQFHVVETPVKFGVTSQSLPTTYNAGDEIDVTWNVASTDIAPINTTTVDILLFTGTHLDFDLDNTIILAKNVFNSGTCKVIVPNEITERGRIIVKASERNYFSINARNITVLPPTTPKLIVNSDPISYIECIPSGSFTYEISSEGLLGIEGEVTYSILEGLPNGANATFEPETVEIGSQSTLTIDPINDPIGQDYEIRIGATTESGDTYSRLVYLNLKSSDHAEIDAIEPAKDAAGVGVSTPFTWSASQNADFYKFELSKSPAFGSTNIETVSGLTDISYVPDVFLEKNTVYYWRVTASNYCGDDPSVKTFAFATESLFCSEMSPADGVLPINISGSGTPTIQAPIEVNIAGNVADINVKRFFGEHGNNKDMVVSLISPDDKQVILVNKKCSQQDFNCAFDDDSNVDVQCPLNNGSTYRPFQNLSDFNGDALSGTWIFQIEDTKPGNGGKLEDVIVQFCSNQVLDNPFIVRNEKIDLPIETTVTISSDLLEIDDNNNTNDELIYTIVELPKSGVLNFDGNAVVAGDQFSQKDVDDNKLSYTSSSQNYTTYFSFTVVDGEGGFIGITNFEIEVSGGMTSTEEEQLKEEISLYPVPAQNVITIDFSKSTQEYSSYEIVNLQGQIMQKNNLLNGDIVNLDITQLTRGLYIINFRSNNSLVSKKMIVN